MQYGMALGSAPKPLPAYVETIERYEAMGLDSVWSAQLFGADALTVFALAGATTSHIRLGTAVIPTYSRHPLVLASQALTTQAATGNRLVLGVGSSHRDLVEGVLGADYERPAAYLRTTVVHCVYERSRASGREQRRLDLVRSGAATSVDGPTGGLADAVFHSVEGKRSQSGARATLPPAAS